MWGFITIASIVICVMQFKKAIKSVVSYGNDKENTDDKLFVVESFDEQEVLPKEALSVSKREYYLTTYVKAFQTLNIKILSSVMTDLFYHMTESKVQGLTRRGLRQIISIEEVEEGNDSHKRTFMNYGGISTIIDYIKANYIEQILDSTNGKILYEKKIPNAQMQLILNKSNVRDAAETRYCSGCGTTLNTEGELFICPNCGAVYKADSFEWVINRVKVQELKNNLMDKITKKLMAGVVAAVIIGFLFWKIPVIGFLMGVLNVLILVFGFWYRWFVKYTYKALYQLRNQDECFSIVKIDTRMNFLMKLIYDARNYNIDNLKSFMDPDEFIKLKNSYQVPQDFVVDVQILFCVLTNLRKQGDREYLTVTYYLPKKIILTDQNQKKFSYSSISFDVYRNANVKYSPKTQMESFYCENCGMPINLSMSGTCKFCGKAYDLAEYDWIIHKINKI